MSRRFPRAAAAALLTLAAAVPVFAVVGGEFDADNEFPNVGALVVTKTPVNVPGVKLLPQTYSSCTLVHPRVVLTAGHAVEGLRSLIENNSNIGDEDVVVMFSPDVHDGGAQYAIRSMDIHKGYTGRNADSIDVGVIVLEEPVQGVTPLALPDAGYLADLDLDRGPSDTKPSIFVAGYGTTVVPQLSGGFPPGLRNVAEATFKSLRPKYLMLSQNFELGEGGLSRGDSGGAAIWTESDGSRVQVGITVSGDAVSVSYGSCVRTDLPTVLEFVQAAIDGLDD